MSFFFLVDDVCLFVALLTRCRHLLCETKTKRRKQFEVQTKTLWERRTCSVALAVTHSSTVPMPIDDDKDGCVLDLQVATTITTTTTTTTPPRWTVVHSNDAVASKIFRHQFGDDVQTVPRHLCSIAKRAAVPTARHPKTCQRCRSAHLRQRHH
jgi:hypothetical protein